MMRVLWRFLSPAGLFLAFLLVWSACTASLPENGAPVPDTVVTVERVVDGDTIVVNGTQSIPGDERDKRPGRETVRLIGVDTPETVHPRKPVECFGKQASDYTKAKLPKGITVTLKFDTGTDQFRDRTPGRRLLAYVWLTNGQMLNLLLVQGGYAKASHYPPQDDWKDRFKAAQDRAQARHRGRWAACPTT